MLMCGCPYTDDAEWFYYEPDAFTAVHTPWKGEPHKEKEFSTIDWVICGCESGAVRRHTDGSWIRDLRDQCQAAGVPFFLKQIELGGRVVKAPELDGRQWLEVPV